MCGGTAELEESRTAFLVPGKESRHLPEGRGTPMEERFNWIIYLIKIGERLEARCPGRRRAAGPHLLAAPRCSHLGHAQPHCPLQANICQRPSSLRLCSALLAASPFPSPHPLFPLKKFRRDFFL